MKSYTKPEIELVELNASDIITASLGTETTPRDEDDGIWDFDLA